MNAALRELKGLKANGCVLLGDTNYYRRFGFKPIGGLALPDAPLNVSKRLHFKVTHLKA